MALDNIDANDWRKYMENERFNIKFRRALAGRLFQYLSAKRTDVQLADMMVPSVVQMTEKDGIKGFLLGESKNGNRFDEESFVEHFLPADFAFGETAETARTSPDDQ